MSAVPSSVPQVRVRAVSPRAVLAGIVAGATALQALLATAFATPAVFPDEYLYSQLARSLATTGRLQVRGVSAHFLPVLEPILTAPMWLTHDVGTAYRLIQVENAFVMSLAAIPAYLLARRLGARSGLALGVAALCVAAPPALFSAMILSEPFAYPLALAVAAAAVAAIERPTRRAQLVLLAFCGLAVFARLQLAALPACAAVAIVVVALRERRVRATLREHALFLAVVALGALAGLLVAVVHGLGYYQGIAPVPGAAGDALRVAGIDVFVVLLATGAAIAPSAVVGLALAVAKPRTRAELAFGAFAWLSVTLVVVQCVLWGDVRLVQERYLGYLLPLLALGFALRASRPHRRPVAEVGVAAALAAVAALVPLSGYAVDAEHGLAPTLYALVNLQALLDSPGNSAAVFALGATVLAGVGAATTSRRRGAMLTLALSLAASATLLVAASSWGALLSKDGRDHYLPPDEHWVDDAITGPKTLVVLGKASKSPTLATLFWNTSVDRVLRTPGSKKVDFLDDPVVQVGDDGTIHDGGRPLRGPVVLAEPLATTVALRDARRLSSYGPTSLWLPRSDVRLASMIHNRIATGRVLHAGGIQVWHPGKRFDGWIELRVGTPPPLTTATVVLRGGGHRASVTVATGKSGVLRVAACGTRPWRGKFFAAPVGFFGNNWVSPVLSSPRYVPDPAACS